MNIFRVGFSWERMQSTLNSELEATEFERLDNVVKYITDNGAVAILNPDIEIHLLVLRKYQIQLLLIFGKEWPRNIRIMKMFGSV